ncbi:threonine/serine exporter [Secundilactobacillus kimchicus]|uniref:Threonine/Serine exporter ThrE domain-containing protein n=2 Tax=Secundilactobacillus kimchicus TaxID=528209 RepID=A0A0R1HQ19_9LACO|nr:threonine/serine exporter family protein [Secundilactobacillus kimchicus]KRK48917.1 hypothetical protein FC96_GL001238 [Secundilactobacillus kimchicus JCM 15530]MBT9671888.1 threonine/serine exporter [Secundilactobacillus kimchicus]
MTMLIIDLLFTYIATVAFGVLLNLPHRALNMAGLIGTLSFLAYKLLMMAHSGLVTANLVGAVLIGVLSMQAAKWLKMPVIIFNIPALVPFVPGGQAYQMVKNFALADNTVAFSFLFQVIEIAGAIAFGFLLAELFIRLQQKLLDWLASRRKASDRDIKRY